ncbi:hypothetical protein ESB13_17065 [Filimonas effusa]|uniref:Copper chaperone NosL n=2 Tax=Filimonas effusa TaxID=2508721 RepID=A0A4Q1D8F2_9BACT|nr:hypothetical protein ESB13_17065 [Filimonas effusa]
MNTKALPRISTIFILLAAVCLAISLFVPIWQIELNAPQYPEGLALQIWASKIAGDVDIINGLNHYIGMKTLHTKDFIEFTILPYIISAYVVLFLVVAWRRTKKLLNIACAAFILFGVVAMVDFWIWEYNYGHNLDPNAAIKVPGMAYQPPLIGFKQLLNFGAYSIPHIGGWLFVAAGILLLAAMVVARPASKPKLPKNIVAILTLIVVTALSSCGTKGPERVNLNKDACEYCRMTISDGRFAGEIITKKGRVHKFDDIACLLNFEKAQEQSSVKARYVSDFLKNDELIQAAPAWYVATSGIKSPMNGNVAAFASKEAAEAHAAQWKATVETWEQLAHKMNHPHDNPESHHH